MQMKFYKIGDNFGIELECGEEDIDLKKRMEIDNKLIAEDDSILEVLATIACNVLTAMQSGDLKKFSEAKQKEYDFYLGHKKRLLLTG
jgi:hypothetical protein